MSNAVVAPQQSGLEMRLTPDKVMGFALKNGTLWYNIQWRENQTTDWVLNTEAHALCPKLVIQYYEHEVLGYPQN